ncbi:Cell division protein ZapE [Aquicella siphonis]|uniref:Cell division protein ZapE n=2 Tax=Aquicella siphonis TaxID=254247 RepID=A0A5E4PJI2_9COXI|nr:Cell division protein ZapE [Aquicella siphonis]
MTPLDYYRDLCSKGLILEDQHQLEVMNDLQLVYLDIVSEHKKQSRISSIIRKSRLVKGLYLWGGVGVGKTFMMDCFYHCIPYHDKKRMHFHQFMQLIHHELKKYQGKKDPLSYIADDLAKNTSLLCFDEFIVTDIADAMLLGRLLKLLFSRRVCLVATSNTMPDDLYKNGLQRKSFLPAISLIKQHTHVVHIPAVMDYRMRSIKRADLFYIPHDRHAVVNMERIFARLARHESVTQEAVIIHDRAIPVIARSHSVIWFDYRAICTPPRSQNDYLDIVRHYSTIMISDIPLIAPEARNQITLFIKMIDIFYDHHVCLICSAAGEPDEIYKHGSLLSEYSRTRSRLLEMQSDAYRNQCMGRRHD